MELPITTELTFEYEIYLFIEDLSLDMEITYKYGIYL